MSDIFNQLMVLGFMALPFVVALGLALGICLAVLVFPRPLLFMLLIAAVVFPSSPTDALGNATGFNVYGKGGGYLFFSLYELSLIFLSLGALLLAGWRITGAAPHHSTGYAVRGDPYFWWYLGFGVLFVGYVAIWFAENYDRWPVVFTRAGVINIIFQGCLVAALIAHLRDPVARHRMFAAVGGVAAIMMVWGLLRYVALGGDPQGSYEEHGGTGLLRITYWDINYSIIAAMLAGWCTWELSVGKSHSSWLRIGLFTLLVVCLADIALSARRTGQIGLFLSLLVVLLLLPKGRRALVLALFAIALPLVAYKLNERIADNRSALQKIVQGDERKQYLVDVRYERSYELRLAMEEVRKSPLFGVGPGGIFQPKSSIGLQYHQGNYGFIHSGLGHVLFKTGVVGLFIFCGLLLTYLSLLRRTWPLAEGRDKSLLMASMCGMACSLPNLLVGTPIIEIRSMVVMGVCLAIPALLSRGDSRRPFVSAQVRAS